MFRKQLLAFVIIISLILFNRWIFAMVFDTDYLLWYISNGTFISFGIIFIFLVSKDFNKDVNTVSANFLTYLATYLRYLAISIGLFGTLMRANARVADMSDDTNTPDSESDEANTNQSTTSLNMFSLPRHLVDSLLLMIRATILFIVIFLWIAVVIPLQYFVFLICGAPARYFHPADYRAIIGKEDEKLTIKYIKNSTIILDGWQDASLRIEPFPLINLLSILFFAAVKLMVL